MSLRERLRAKARATTVYDLVVDDPTEAHRSWQAARASELAARARHGVIGGAGEEHPDVVAAAARTAAAWEQLQGCVEHVRLAALRPDEFEALIAAHPPTVEQRKADPQAAWNHDTLRPALLAACADTDMTEQDWAEFLASDRCSAGERDGLYHAALSVNTRTPQLAIPKDSTPTLA